MSKVPNELISKFNLKQTNIHNGQSFVNDCKTYLWPNLVRGHKSYLMECDTKGEPLKEGKLLLFIRKPGEGRQFTWPIQLLYDNTHDMVKKIVNHQLMNQ